ncbi:MAG: TRAP transporter small permease [Saprospiraceae bacterium]|nr:TRAP transporter small permease [Saprospiraceae bacterium]MDP4821562.1 TRAP transporter small permease [Saprospiraceae bacterium]MDP4999691.1 TRAP transporter small permease [Saprospiraceae bacterium]
MRKKIDRILGGVLAFLMGTMTLDVLWQVMSRYLLKAPSSFTDELARFLLVWIGVLGAAYVAGQDRHLAIDLLPSRLSGRRKKRLLVLIAALIVVFAVAVMVVGGSRLVYVTLYLGQKSSALQLPLGYVYLIVPISGLLVVYYKLDSIAKMLKND